MTAWQPSRSFVFSNFLEKLLIYNECRELACDMLLHAEGRLPVRSFDANSSHSSPAMEAQLSGKGPFKEFLCKLT